MLVGGGDWIVLTCSHPAFCTAAHISVLSTTALFLPSPFQLLSTNCAGSGGDKAGPDTFLSAALLLHGWASHTYLLGGADVGTALLPGWGCVILL